MSTTYRNSGNYRNSLNYQGNVNVAPPYSYVINLPAIKAGTQKGQLVTGIAPKSGGS